MRFSEIKVNCFPRDQSLIVYCFFSLVYKVNVVFFFVLHLYSGSTAVFIGNISRKGSEFVFNSEATISGQPGVITMCLYDNDNKFSKDTQRINLKPGECGHLYIISQGAHRVCLCNRL